MAITRNSLHGSAAAYAGFVAKAQGAARTSTLTLTGAGSYLAWLLVRWAW